MAILTSIAVSAACGTLNTDTVLAGNEVSNGTCFTFNASDITLDCAGFTITGNGTGTGVLFDNSVVNSTVQNCNVRNFSIGINIDTAANITVQNNNISDILVGGGVALASIAGPLSGGTSMVFGNFISADVVGVNPSRPNVHIENNTIVGPPSNAGINGGTDAGNLLIVSNDITAAVAIALRHSFNEIRDNMLNATSAIGSLSLQAADASNNTIVGNVITGTVNGIRVVFSGGENNAFTDNTIMTGDEWIRTVTVTNTTFTNTTFNNSNGYIRLLPTFVFPSDTTLDTTILNITPNKAFLNSSTIPALNVSAEILLNGVLLNNPQAAVDLNDDGTFEQCTFCQNLSYVNNIFRFNTTHFTTFIASESCGSINTSTALNTSLTSNGTCITIDADNVTFTCNGFTISGNGTGIGVNVTDQSNVTVKNCNINTFNYNVFVENTNDSLFFNNTLRDSVQEGLEMTGSNRNNITKNDAVGINSPAINVTSSTNITVDSNLAVGTNSTAISINGASAGAIVRHNNATGAVFGLTITSTPFTVIGNRGVGNTSGDVGIVISSSSNGFSANNTGIGDGNGIRISVVTDSEFSGDIANSSGTTISYGIFSGTNRNNFTNVQGIATSAATGISVLGTDNRLVNTTGTTINGVGINLASGGHRNTLINNTATGNTGLRFSSGAANNTLSGLIASGPVGLQFLGDGGGNLVANSTSSITGTSRAVEFSSSTGNTIQNLAVNTDTGTGINFVSSVNNSLNDIVIRSNTTWLATDGNSIGNNITRTKFNEPDGSLETLPGVLVPPDTTVNQAKLSVAFNSVFLNSTNLTFLNASSQITLFNLSQGAGAFPLVDFGDDGTFEPCQAPVCTPVSFVGGTFIFNVSRFTTFSSTIGGVNITVTKTDNPDPVFAGEQLNYTITINVTNGTAFNLTVTELYPSGTTFVNASPTPDTGTNTTFSLGNLTIGQSTQINITVFVASNLSGGFLNNTINVTYQNSTGANLSTVVSELTNILGGAPTVNVTKNDSADPVVAGNQFNYTVVINVSNGTAFNVTLTDVLPSGLQFVSANPAPDTGNSTWTFGNITFPNVTTVTITVLVPIGTANGTIFNNTANVTFQNSTGGNLSSAVTENTTILSATPVVTINKTDTPDPVNASKQLNYTITLTVTNGTAFNFTVTDLFPPETTFVNASPAPDSGNDTWAFGNVSNGTITINITVLVSGSTKNGTVINNTANVTFQNSTGNTLSFGTVENTTVLNLPPNITVTKIDSQDPVGTNTQFTYTINVTNNGTGTAVNVTVIDTLPSQADFVNATPSPDNGTNTTFSLGDMLPGTTQIINITVKLDGSIGGTVTISNKVDVTYQNASGGLLTASASEPTTVNGPTLGGGGGGSGGGGVGRTYAVEGDTANTLLRVGDRLQFTYAGQQHSMLVNSMIGDTVTVTIASTAKRYALQTGTPIQVDITGDNVADLIIGLNYVNRGQAMIHLEKLQTGAATQFPPTQPEPPQTTGAPEPATTEAVQPAAAEEPQTTLEEITPTTPEPVKDRWTSTRLWLTLAWALGLIIVLTYTLTHIRKHRKTTHHKKKHKTARPK